MENPNISKLVPLIQNGMINIRTSTNYDGSHSAANIALFNSNDPNETRDGSEGWVSSVVDQEQFVILGGEIPKKFVAITLQGRGDQDQWVTKYKLSYTLDGINWTEYRNGRTIQGCWDRNSPSVHFFDQPFIARTVSINPVTWKGAIALRMELYVEQFEYYNIPINSYFMQNGSVSIPVNSSLQSSSASIRTLVVPVVFDQPFKYVPKITLSFSKLNVNSQGHPHYCELTSGNITSKGFDLTISVGPYNILNSSQVDYVAIQQPSNQSTIQ